AAERGGVRSGGALAAPRRAGGGGGLPGGQGGAGGPAGVGGTCRGSVLTPGAGGPGAKAPGEKGSDDVDLLGRWKAELKEAIEQALSRAESAGRIRLDGERSFEVEVPPEKAHGDFSTNAALALARAAKTKPRDLAQVLAIGRASWRGRGGWSRWMGAR